MIEMLEGFPDDVVAFAFRGNVTKRDYDTVLVPEFEGRLTRHRKVGIYCEISSGFSAFGPGAVRADWKFGVAHYFDWNRCAIVSDERWVKRAAKLTELFGFLWPGRYRTFTGAEAELAREWVARAGDKCGGPGRKGASAPWTVASRILGKP